MRKDIREISRVLHSEFSAQNLRALRLWNCEGSPYCESRPRPVIQTKVRSAFAAELR